MGLCTVIPQFRDRRLKNGSPQEGNQQQVRFRLTHNVNARRKTATRVTNLSLESEASNPRNRTRRPTAAAGQKPAAADPTGPPVDDQSDG